jgi:DNA repair exonuclease SbcCD nuclease subunit
MAVRFLHTSDWHIGLKSAHIGEKSRDARHKRYQAVSLIADMAKEERVDFVIITGDMFDSHNIDDRAVRSTVEVLNRFAPINVFVLPGNHDPLLAGGIWDRIAWKEAGSHIRLITESKEIQVTNSAVLFPCPVAQKLSRTDPTAWIPERTADDERIRIGVAHGALDVLPFPGNFPITSDRQNRSGLDYLALGDWHSFRRHGRSVYSGTPEQTRFDETEPGNVVIVQIDETQSEPVLTKRRVGQLTWREYSVPVNDETDVQALRSSIYGNGAVSEQLLRIRATLVPGIPQNAVNSVKSLRDELAENAFYLEWPLETLEPPVNISSELPDGIMSEIDTVLQSMLDGNAQEMPDRPHVITESSVASEAKVILRRLYMEGKP